MGHQVVARAAWDEVKSLLGCGRDAEEALLYSRKCLEPSERIQTVYIRRSCSSFVGLSESGATKLVRRSNRA